MESEFSEISQSAGTAAEGRMGPGVTSQEGGKEITPNQGKENLGAERRGSAA